MNYMEQIAEMLGQELKQNFEVYDKDKRYGTCRLYKKGLYTLNYTYSSFEKDNDTLQKLLTGEYEIKWKPKIGHTFYFPSFQWCDGFDSIVYTGSQENENIIKNVGGYKTKEQAQEKAKELGWVK